MRGQALLALAMLLVASLPGCGRSTTAPETTGRLVVFVYWQGQGLPDRQLQIVELDLVRRTNSAGVAEVLLPAGSYTLRAFITVGGPAGFQDFAVTIRPGETDRLSVQDCLPCVSPN